MPVTGGGLGRDIVVVEAGAAAGDILYLVLDWWELFISQVLPR